MLGGRRDRDVLHLHADTLSTHAAPSGLSAVGTAPHRGCESAADGRADSPDGSDGRAGRHRPLDGLAGASKTRATDSLDGREHAGPAVAAANSGSDLAGEAPTVGLFDESTEHAQRYLGGF
jgi:hypothetical protein